MVNIIRNLFILIMLCGIIVSRASYTMEDRGHSSEHKKRLDFCKIFKKGKQSSRVFLRTATQEDESLSKETSTDVSLPEERTELDYREEHEKVRTLFEGAGKKPKHLNLENKNIFSLPNDLKTMRELSNCRYINFSHNKLDALPDEICEWRALTSLDLSNNQLSMAPWQVFSSFDKNAPNIIIYLADNPIKRIPSEFFEAMMAQKDHRSNFSGFLIEFNQDIIENYILPELEKSPILKKYLVSSFHGNILNGFCKIQNENGEFLSFDKDEQPFFAYGQGVSL